MFEGLSNLNNTYYSITNQRCFSLLDATRQDPTSSELAYTIL